jgi:hypothetical protein
MFQRAALVCELIFCILVAPKCDFGDFEKAMFQGVPLPRELILCLRSEPKGDFRVFLKAMLQGLDWFLRTNFLPFGGLKCELGEVEKAMFHGVAWPCEHFSNSVRFKMQIRRRSESDVSRRLLAVRTHFSPSGWPKTGLG